MHTGYYDINGLVKFSLSGSWWVRPSFRYLNYRTDFIAPEEIDFTITFGSFVPRLEGCTILDGKYYIRNNYFYCKRDHYKALGWAIEIIGLNSPSLHVRVNIYPGYARALRLSQIMLEGIIIDFLIHYVLVEKGLAMVHGSCISRNNRAVIFVARGGAGKTTFATRLIEQGFDYISDNYTILAGSSRALGFVEPLNLFNYNISKHIRSSLRFSQKAELLVKGWCFKITMGYVKLFTTINPVEVFPVNGQLPEVCLVCILLPVSGGEPALKVVGTTREKMIEYICYNQMQEFQHCDRYLTSYGFVFPESNVYHHWQRYREALGCRLSGALYQVEMPLKITEDVVNGMLEVIRNNGL